LPLVEHVREHKGRTIAVLVPELVVRHWWENIMHNQRAQLLKLLLLVKGNQGIVVLDIPWFCRSKLTSTASKRSDQFLER
jgi:hypothetical protein